MDTDTEATDTDDDAVEIDNSEAAESDIDEAAEPDTAESAEPAATKAPNDDNPSPSEDLIKRRARALAHKNEKSRSSVLLEEARKAAKEQYGYNSVKAREEMVEECKKRSGNRIIPHDWQLDIAECLLLGVDCELIAPTGAGKTIPFVLPLFYNKKKVMIIISPLNALEEDQARRFRELGIAAVPVNGTTYTDKLHKEITNGKHRIIVTSPDMCLEHDHFRSLLNAPAFARAVCGFIIDEAHCITQWGDRFREVYLRLGTLRAFVSARVPFLVTSATLTPADLTVIRKSVHLESNDTYHLNLGNDRPNLTWRVHNMKAGKSDLESLSFLLPTEDEPKLKRAIVFFDDISVSMDVCRWFREQLPANMRGRVACYNSRRGESSKRDSYQRFCDGELDIWFASEAAGIGCDIPKIEVVTQFMVPASLSIWLQRAGRAARQRGDHGVAYLLVQPTVFQEKGKTTRQEGDEVEYVKAIEDGLRRWIETENCRRDIADDYFFNPPNRDEPVDVCCDNCQTSTGDGRPSTPDNDDAASIVSHSTPSKTRNANGKRVMRDPELGPATRQKEHLAQAKQALYKWRSDVWFERYSLAPYGVEAVLPDTVLNALAARGRWRTINDITDTPAAKWKWLQRHGADVLAILKKVDHDVRQKRDDEVRSKMEAKKAETARRNAEKARLKQLEQARKREERERQKEERKRQPPKSWPSRARKSSATVQVPALPVESANIANVLSNPYAAPQYPPQAPSPLLQQHTHIPSIPSSGISRSNSVSHIHDGNVHQCASVAATSLPPARIGFSQHRTAMPFGGGHVDQHAAPTTPGANIELAQCDLATPVHNGNGNQRAGVGSTSPDTAQNGFMQYLIAATPVRQTDERVAATPPPPGYRTLQQYSGTRQSGDGKDHQQAAIATMPALPAYSQVTHHPAATPVGNTLLHVPVAETPPSTGHYGFAWYPHATPVPERAAHLHAAMVATPAPSGYYMSAQRVTATPSRPGDVPQRVAMAPTPLPSAANISLAHDPSITPMSEDGVFQRGIVEAMLPPANDRLAHNSTAMPVHDGLQRMTVAHTPTTHSMYPLYRTPKPVLYRHGPRLPHTREPASPYPPTSSEQFGSSSRLFTM